MAWTERQLQSRLSQKVLPLCVAFNLFYKPVPMTGTFSRDLNSLSVQVYLLFLSQAGGGGPNILDPLRMGSAYLL